jgi:murein tripeptide amidase MpaA
VPCVNPDGAFRGNHRTNALGTDLNRAWLSPDPATAPEVAAIKARMDETGVALALDIHGDEEIPYNFASGGEGTPST